jgi:serine/threonine protein kinase
VQVCRALEEAHAINCIHRDIKPENIFLSEKPPCEGEAKLGDFGIAKIIESAGCGTIIGTPWYIAPEVYGGKESDSRLDIYSLGVTMYQLLAGDIPHDSRLAHGPFVEAVIRGKTKPISEYPNVDSRLGEIAMKSISVKPESRYQSASEMKAALEGICVDLSVESLLERAKQGTRPDVAEAEAKAGLAELVKQFPKSKRVYIELANLLRRMGSAAEAADVYQDALSHMVHDPELLYLLAHNYAAMGKYYLAIGFMEQALQSGGGTLDAKEIGCGKKVLVAWKKSAAKTKA